MALIFLGGAFVGVTAADNTVITKGPYYWSNNCGETIEVTVTIDTAPADYPGLYKWDYQIKNHSAFYSNGSGVPGVTCPVARVGLSDFEIYLPQETPDIGNWSGPENTTGWIEFRAGDNLLGSRRTHLYFTVGPL